MTSGGCGGATCAGCCPSTRCWRRPSGTPRPAPRCSPTTATARRRSAARTATRRSLCWSGAGFGGPGDRPLLAAGLSEGFPGSPLDRLADDAAALRWWRRYVEQVVPPVLHAYLRHGVVLESHLQNVLVGMDRDGFPDRAVFRDHEGVKLLQEQHGELLAAFGPDLPTPGLSAADGWKRLVYCLVTNHLLEIAGAVAEHRPGVAPALWPLARPVFAGYADHREVADLLAAATVPAKTNLLLRWTAADGGDSAYVPLANPLAC
ncbi:IucA/IucC family C-terminal-domain containing protein [Streptacidiphilus sp. PAMC 29251]